MSDQTERCIRLHTCLQTEIGCVVCERQRALDTIMPLKAELQEAEAERDAALADVQAANRMILELKCRLEGLLTVEGLTLLEAALAENKRLREALNKYGFHDLDCQAAMHAEGESPICNCGLDAALRGGEEKASTTAPTGEGATR